MATVISRSTTKLRGQHEYDQGSKRHSIRQLAYQLDKKATGRAEVAESGHDPGEAQASDQDQLVQRRTRARLLRQPSDRTRRRHSVLPDDEEDFDSEEIVVAPRISFVRHSAPERIQTPENTEAAGAEMETCQSQWNQQSHSVAETHTGGERRAANRLQEPASLECNASVKPTIVNDSTYCSCGADGRTFNIKKVIRCDNRNCQQFFHLRCVGLAEWPIGRYGWFCPNCLNDHGDNRQETNPDGTWPKEERGEIVYVDPAYGYMEVPQGGSASHGGRQHGEGRNDDAVSDDIENEQDEGDHALCGKNAGSGHDEWLP